MQPVLSPIAAIAASSARRARARSAPQRARRAWPRPSWRAAPASWISVGATHATAGWASVHTRRQLQQRQPVAIGDRPQLVEPRAARVDPAGRAGSGGGRSRRASPRRARRRGTARRSRRRARARCTPWRSQAGQREPARPGLERIEDQHRPVDQVAEALQAADDVEREAVGRPGRDADRVAEARLAQAGHRLPDGGRGVAHAIGVVQQQHVEVVDAAALRGCARSPRGDSAAYSSGPRRSAR